MSIEWVRKYEPVMHFAMGENFFPMNAAGYVSHCSLHASDGDMLIPPPFVDLQALAEFPSRDHFLTYASRRVGKTEDEEALRRWIERQRTERADFRAFLKELKDKAKSIGVNMAKIFLPLKLPVEVRDRAIANYGGIGKNPPTYYYRVLDDHGYTVLQYWFFYAYNDFGSTHGGVNDHEADWESIHLFLKDDEPVWAAYSSHLGGGKEIGRPWDPAKMNFEDDHPIVYVGAGSHASYHTSEGDPGVEGFEPGNVVVGSAGGIPWAEPQPLDAPWFTDYQGLWGWYAWDNPNPVVKILSAKGGAPAGPKFDREGGIRPKWDKPAEYAGLA
ncbi:MAG: hypothetical protein AB8I69_02625 [Anaerolineae bacterium]|jgi:hypothetical protein